MTDLRQAAQQALEALIDAANVLSAPMFADAVAALSKALAQEHAMHNLARLGQEIEQEPLGSIALARSLCYQINGAADDTDDIDGGGYGSVDIAEILSAEVVRLQKALAQPEQEPVAYYHPRNGFYWAKPTSIFAPTVVDVPPIPLYTSAAQREWQSLTDEDWEKVANRKNTVLDTFEQGAVWAAYKLERRNK